MKLERSNGNKVAPASKHKKIRKTRSSLVNDNPIKRRNSSDMTTDTSRNSQSKFSINHAKPVKRTIPQTKITDSFRFSQLVYSRLSDLAYKLNMSISTASQTFELLKRYLLKTSIPNIKIELAMLSCFLIVCKFYEYWGKVVVRDLVNYCGGLFSREILIEMQAHILYTIDFQIQQICSKSSNAISISIEG